MNGSVYTVTKEKCAYTMVKPADQKYISRWRWQIRIQVATAYTTAEDLLDESNSRGSGYDDHKVAMQRSSNDGYGQSTCVYVGRSRLRNHEDICRETSVSTLPAVKVDSLTPRSFLRCWFSLRKKERLLVKHCAINY